MVKSIRPKSKPEINQKAVLVTGCSAGIGKATAIYLSKRGFIVLATVRKEVDAVNLRNLNESNLIPICPLDLSKLEEIPNVLQLVQQELSKRGIDNLYAIINNAGGGSIAPIELMDLKKFRIEMETRILGPIGLLQVFLPMIRKTRGRIIWIATPAIIPISFVASIHACDFAVNCLVRTLNLELQAWKIPNILVRCGGVSTTAPGKSYQELEKSFHYWPSDRLELYMESLEKEVVFLKEFDQKRTDPETIAAVVYKALCAKKPKNRYQIGYLSKAAALLEYLPQSLADWILKKRG